MILYLSYQYENALKMGTTGGGLDMDMNQQDQEINAAGAPV